uniref:Uncharacterized protein n=1 Tax=Strigamia maritima TaxID=126957 RepID=T1J354_STRMM
MNELAIRNKTLILGGILSCECRHLKRIYVECCLGCSSMLLFHAKEDIFTNQCTAVHDPGIQASNSKCNNHYQIDHLLGLGWLSRSTPLSELLVFLVCFPSWIVPSPFRNGLINDKKRKLLSLFLWPLLDHNLRSKQCKLESLLKASFADVQTLAQPQISSAFKIFSTHTCSDFTLASINNCHAIDIPSD